MPSSRQVRITRTAISPRFAIRTFSNTALLPRAYRFPLEQGCGPTGYRAGMVSRALPSGSANDDPMLSGHAPRGAVPFAEPERLAVVDSTNRYLLDLVEHGLADGPRS